MVTVVPATGTIAVDAIGYYVRKKFHDMVGISITEVPRMDLRDLDVVAYPMSVWFIVDDKCICTE